MREVAAAQQFARGALVGNLDQCARIAAPVAPGFEKVRRKNVWESGAAQQFARVYRPERFNPGDPGESYRTGRVSPFRGNPTGALALSEPTVSTNQFFPYASVSLGRVLINPILYSRPDECAEPLRRRKMT
jgi:hypothetical protein